MKGERPVRQTGIPELDGWIVYDHTCQCWLPGTFFVWEELALKWIQNANSSMDYEAVPVRIVPKRPFQRILDVSRATASDLVIHFGMTARYWTRMASEGKVPGAWQPSGHGGKWLFDLDAVRRWQRSRMREVLAWPGYISAAKHIGDAPSVRGKNTDSPSAPRIEQLLKSVCGNG